MEKLAKTEERAYSDAKNPLVAWGPEELAAALAEAGYNSVSMQTQSFTDTRRMTNREIDAWCSPGSSYGRALASAFSPDELPLLQNLLRAQLVGRDIDWVSTVAFATAVR